MLKKVTDILKCEMGAKSAVMCFECVNYEQTAWCIEAAEELGRPVTIMLYFDMAFYTPENVFLAMAKTLAENASVPVGLTYVFPDSFDMAMGALKSGFPTVTYDPRAESLDEKIIKTAEFVRSAHALGADVIGNPGDGEFTAEELCRFASETGVDAMIAPVVYEDEGNRCDFTEKRHWYETNKSYVNFELLNAVSRGCGIPLVLHHAYNVSGEELVKAVRLGVAKIDDGCPFDTAFYNFTRECLNGTDCGESFFGLQLEVKEKMKKYISGRISLISGGKSCQ